MKTQQETLLRKCIAYLFRKIPEKKIDYAYLLWKLAKLQDTSEYEVFKKAGNGYSILTINNAFKQFLTDGFIPWWVKQHLEENLEEIKRYRLPFTVIHPYRW